MNIVFLGGQTAGLIGLLSAASAHTILSVTPYCPGVEEAAWRMGFPLVDMRNVPECDVILSVHCRQIIPAQVLVRAARGGVNVHPCLSQFKGADPIGRLIKSGTYEASVGAHRMTQVVDEGEVLVERFRHVLYAPLSPRSYVYEQLYDLYAIVTHEALQKV